VGALTALFSRQTSAKTRAMHRLTLLALVISGLAALWLAGPTYARSTMHPTAVVAQICLDAGDLQVDALDPLASKPQTKPQTLKACSGQKNRLAVPCQTERCLPVEQMALAFRPPERQFPPHRAQNPEERADPDGQFRPPRLSA